MSRSGLTIPKRMKNKLPVTKRMEIMKFRKIMASFIPLIILLIFSCQTSGTSDDRNPESIVRNYNQLGYDLNNPDRIIPLPGILHEISGITEIDTSTIASIQDEDGVLFIFDLTDNRIKSQFFFGNPGDYEGIARFGKRIFVLRSDGVIFEISDYGKPGRASASYVTGIPAKDNEGLCYDIKNNRLLIGPKSNIEGEKKSKRAIYGFDLVTRKLIEKPVIKFDMSEIRKYAVKNKLDVPMAGKKKEKPEPIIELRTSALGIHPLTKKLYLISGIEKLLFVFDLNGTVEYIEKLDPVMFKQPEGITFLTNGDMIISNEGQAGRANLLRFNYRRK